ncbi:MAG: NAD(P)/FAD-dependent oxidoreductase [Acidobacteriota bacterium]
METCPRVAIVGAGFGGLAAARKLRRAPVSILLIDKNNFHTFQPLLYQVATAGLEPSEIAHAVRGIFHSQKNFDFRLGEVTGIDLAARTLSFSNGTPVSWDYLILSPGATNNDFGIPGVAEHAIFLKTLQEALALRNHVIEQFEAANVDPSLVEQGVLNFVLIGGGATGVEMAGALIELIGQVLRRDYPHLPVDLAKIILVERSPELLTPFHPKSQRHALAVLRERGVDVRLNESIVSASAEGVKLGSGAEIRSRSVIWTAGIKAMPFAELLGIAPGRGGRLAVEPDLSLPGHPEVFAIGDLAGTLDAQGKQMPQIAQVAIQGGHHAACQIARRIAGKASEPFRYFNPGVMATIGRNAAVAELPGGLRFTGRLGWLMWLFLHLMYLVGFRNRLSVFINWTWSYFTWDRSARLILEPEGRKATPSSNPPV